MGVGQEDQVTGSFRRLSDRIAPEPIPLLMVMVLMVVTVVVLIEFIIMGVSHVSGDGEQRKIEDQVTLVSLRLVGWIPKWRPSPTS